MYKENKDLSETHVIHPCLIRWRGIVDAAEHRGYFWPRDLRAAKEWNTCAVGEAREYGMAYYADKGFSGFINDKLLHREGLPKDNMLYYLGVDFYRQVVENDFAGCRDTIDQIEKQLNRTGE